MKVHERTIIHISFSSLNSTLSTAMFIPQLIEVGYEVIYIDLNSMLSMTTNHDPAFIPLIKHMASIEDLKEFLKDFSNKNTILNIQIPPDKNLQEILKNLFALPFKKTFYDMGNFPSVYKFRHLEFIKKIFKRVILKPDFIFRSGHVSYIKFPRKSKIFPMNFLDYDKKFDLDQKPTLINQPYLLFIDQSIPLHPDFDQFGGSQINEAEYYNSIYKYLLRVSKEKNLIPVIALHPKSNLKNSDLSGIQIYSGETDRLIKYADIIFTHYSSSVSLAVIYKKPIVFITNNLILECNLNAQITRNIKNLSDFFGSKILNYDLDSIQEKHVKINFACYRRYLFNYVTTQETFKEHSIAKILKSYDQIFESLK